MAIKKVFKCRIPSSKYLFSNGKEANFIGGRYMTDVEAEIAALEGEIKLGHPHIYVDSAEKEVDTEQMDPIEQIKKKAIAEYIAAQTKAINTSNDMGNTEQGKLQGIGNSSSTAMLATGSDSSTAVNEGSQAPAATPTAAPASLADLAAKVQATATVKPASLPTTK